MALRVLFAGAYRPAGEVPVRLVDREYKRDKDGKFGSGGGGAEDDDVSTGPEYTVTGPVVVKVKKYDNAVVAGFTDHSGNHGPLDGQYVALGRRRMDSENPASDADLILPAGAAAGVAAGIDMVVAGRRDNPSLPTRDPDSGPRHLAGLTTADGYGVSSHWDQNGDIFAEGTVYVTISDERPGKGRTNRRGETVYDDYDIPMESATDLAKAITDAIPKH